MTYFGHPCRRDVQRPQDVHAQLLQSSFLLGFPGRKVSSCLHNNGVETRLPQFSGASQEAQVRPQRCFCATL